MFKRSGEKIEVSKLASVTGRPEFYRHYELLPADGGIAFGTTEDLVDQRAPYDPSCHVPHKVEYQYDPATDALAVRRERVTVDFKEGHCVILASDLGAAEPLVRVDRGVADAHETTAPVGRPDLAKNAVTKDSLDNRLDGGQKDSAQNPPNVKTVPVDTKALDALEEKQKKAQKAVPQKIEPPVKPSKAVLKRPAKAASLDNADTPNAIQPPINSAAEPNSPPAQSKAANSPKPRGDAQMAPQAAEPQQQVQKK